MSGKRHVDRNRERQDSWVEESLSRTPGKFQGIQNNYRLRFGNCPRYPERFSQRVNQLFLRPRPSPRRFEPEGGILPRMESLFMPELIPPDLFWVFSEPTSDSNPRQARQFPFYLQMIAPPSFPNFYWPYQRTIEVSLQQLEAVPSVSVYVDALRA